MKKVLLIAALTMASAPAFATKARSAALQGSHTVATDFQDVFENPQKMWEIGDQATFEYGPRGTTYDAAGDATESATNAEGGFIRTSGDTKWGAYVGRQSTSLSYMLAGATVGKAMTANQGLRRMENPINLMYGMRAGGMDLGFNLYYANSQTKQGTDMSKKSAQGVSLGARTDKWNAGLLLGLGSKVQDTNTGAQEEFKGSTSVKLAGEYAINDDLLGFASITNFGGKHTTNAGVEDMDLDHMAMEIGVESKIKSDVVHFFYGAALNQATEKNKANAANPEKVESMTLPVYFGLEADATSWLVVRTALKQNFLLNSVKVTAGTNSDANDQDSTTGTLGAGLKFGKLIVDGTLAATTAANAGQLKFDTFMTQLGATYTF